MVLLQRKQYFSKDIEGVQLFQRVQLFQGGPSASVQCMAFQRRRTGRERRSKCNFYRNPYSL